MLSSACMRGTRHGPPISPWCAESPRWFAPWNAKPLAIRSERRRLHVLDAHFPVAIAGGYACMHHVRIDDDHVAATAQTPLLPDLDCERSARDHGKAMSIMRVRRIPVADELALEHDGIHDVGRAPELDGRHRQCGFHRDAAC